MEAIETFKVDDKNVEIHYDEDPQNPRTENDNCDMFILFHKRYSLGDKHNYKSEDYSGWDEMEAAIIKEHNPVVIRRIFMIDHSGISIADHSFNDQWDSGMIGFALISRESALKEMNAKKVTKKVKDWAEKYLTATISTYRSYLENEAYGYIIKDKDDNELDSCWGFIGDIDYVKEEATSTAKSIKVPEPINPNQLEFAI